MFNRTVLMHLSLPGGPSLSGGTASFNDSAEDALNVWNQYMAHMHFAVNKSSILPPSDGDGNTSVIMDSQIYGEDFGAAAA